MTLDAAGCPKAVVEPIREPGGGSVVCVEGNPEGLRDAVPGVFARAGDAEFAGCVALGYLSHSDPQKYQAEMDGIANWWAGQTPLELMSWVLIGVYILLMPVAGLVLRYGRRAASNIGDHATKIVDRGGQILTGGIVIAQPDGLGETLEKAGWEKDKVVKLAEQLRIHAEYLKSRKSAQKVISLRVEIDLAAQKYAIHD